MLYVAVGKHLLWHCFSGYEYSSTYGATQFDGNLTPRLHGKLRGVRNCILDGEMCGYNPELQVLGIPELSFAVTFT